MVFSLRVAGHMLPTWDLSLTCRPSSPSETTEANALFALVHANS